MAETSKRPHILLVEDEPGISKLMKMFLEEAGYAVTIAPDGLQGLARFEQVQPDLVLTDFMMPEMNGAELCRTLRRRFAEGAPRVPIILTSALLPIGTDVAELADAFIEKTGSLSVLLATIKRLLGQDAR